MKDSFAIFADGCSFVEEFLQFVDLKFFDGEFDVFVGGGGEAGDDETGAPAQL